MSDIVKKDSDFEVTRDTDNYCPQHDKWHITSKCGVRSIVLPTGDVFYQAAKKSSNHA